MKNTKRKIDPNKPKIKLPIGKNYLFVRDVVKKNDLHTICESGNCPNVSECWGAGTATFMILGDICTRSCKFCSVKTGKPLPVDLSEPEKIANSVKLMKLKHCVITSVDRDDLPDGGAQAWYNTIMAIRKISPRTTIETLIPDFKGNEKNIEKIIEARPEIVSHNMETVKRLTKKIRVYAKYETSLQVLKQLSSAGITTKSGIMAGLGETKKEILQTMDDLLNTGCKIMTIGQYLQPTKHQIKVKRFITAEEFEEYKKAGIKKGFKIVESSPLVRSSFRAEKHFFK